MVRHACGMRRAVWAFVLTVSIRLIRSFVTNAASVRAERSMWTEGCNLRCVLIVMEAEAETQSLRELVQLYENNRVLWDPKHSDYYNKCKREDAWRQISQQVNMPVKNLKKKMQSLAGSYRREKSRVKRSQVTGSGRTYSYTSKWFAYRWFQFLYDKDIPNNAIDSISREENRVPSPNEETQEGSFSPTYASSVASNSQTIRTTGANLDVSKATSTSSDNAANITRTNKRPTKRRAAAINEDIDLEDAYNILKKTSEKSYDHYDSFGSYVANELRKYDPQIVPYVKKALLDVLFQADIGQFHQHPRGYYTAGYNSSNTSTPLSSLTTQSNPVLPNFTITSNSPNSEHQPDHQLNSQNIKMEVLSPANPDVIDSAYPFDINILPN